MNTSILYALDFDGVICDSAVETAITGWRAACQIWPDMHGEAPAEMIARFREIRPIIETGYESILAMRLLQQGESCEAIFESHGEKMQALMQQAAIDAEQLKKLFGDIRDQWIAADLNDWVAKNPLFEGLASKLRKLPSNDWYIITTKQERFVKHILAANGINLDGERIFGLDRNLSKPQVLTQLLAKHPERNICFVEDRLPTLINVQKQTELSAVTLLFALWGYNTAADKAIAAEQGFTLESLDGFLETALSP